MKHSATLRMPWLCSATLLQLSLLLTAPALAGDNPKSYPEQGTITATGINQVPRQTTVAGPNGTSHSQRVIVITRTYTVQTQNKTYVLDCGKHPHLFSSTPGECGGDKKLQVGDLIHFRIEKDNALIPAPEASNPDQEQRLRILKQDLNSEPDSNQ